MAISGGERMFRAGPDGRSTTVAIEHELSRRQLRTHPETGGFRTFRGADPAHLPSAGNDHSFAQPHHGSVREPILGTLDTRTAAIGPFCISVEYFVPPCGTANRYRIGPFSLEELGQAAVYQRLTTSNRVKAAVRQPKRHGVVPPGLALLLGRAQRVTRRSPRAASLAGE
jgi:hypothetical protein